MLPQDSTAHLAASLGLRSVLSPFHTAGECICLLLFLSFFSFFFLQRQIPAPKKGIAEHSAQLAWRNAKHTRKSLPAASHRTLPGMREEKSSE